MHIYVSVCLFFFCNANVVVLLIQRFVVQGLLHFTTAVVA